MLEVVVSMGILFLVMVLLLNLATTSIWGTREGGERLAAEGHALSVGERYRAALFSSYALDTELAQETITEAGTEYRTTVRASAVEGYSPDLLRLLEIEVAWSSARGPQRTKLALYAAPILR